jgi:hypothetical protein
LTITNVRRYNPIQLLKLKQKRGGMKEEKYHCPDIDCGYTNFDPGECPQCGLPLEKVKGEDYFSTNDDTSSDMSGGSMVGEFNDDPEDMSWYSDEPVGI